MRPVQQANRDWSMQAYVPDEIVISSDSDEFEEDDLEEMVSEPEVIVISSDSEPEEPNQEDIDSLSDLEVEEVDPEDTESEPEVIDISSDSEPEEPNPEDIDSLSDLEDGEIAQVGDVPTVANKPRVGHWCEGIWCTPGNRRNYVDGEGNAMYYLDEPPMDGVEGGLSHVGEGNTFKDTLGGLLYNQWLQNKDLPESEHVSLGGSMYNEWLKSLE